jgi:hypothetical protein
MRKYVYRAIENAVRDKVLVTFEQRKSHSAPTSQWQKRCQVMADVLVHLFSLFILTVDYMNKV